jgi:hypothetical protein
VAIGYPQLMDQYLKYAELREQTDSTGCLDLSSIKFLYPTTLLPLSLAMKKSFKDLVYVPPHDPNVQSYLHLMQQGAGFDSLNKQTYLPVVGLPRRERDSQAILDRIYELGGDIGGKDAFRYLVGELTDNIYQHSMFENALIMAQQYRKKDELHLCIIDDGITIGGSLRRMGIILDDYQGIIDAFQGISSKKDTERGMGLGTSLRLMTEGYKGRMLVVSGKGAIHFGKDAPIGYNLSEMFKYEGTLISMVIPFIEMEVDVYAYAKL